MIRDILVPLRNTGSDGAALDAAMALAKLHHSHVVALVTMEFPTPLVTDFGYVPVEANQRQLEDARADAAAQVTRARAHLEREDISSEVRLTEVVFMRSEETTALQARYADLTVLGGPDSSHATPRFGLTFKDLLLNSGRPVLLMPPGAELTTPPRRVVLAWKPAREASRALHDALPLLAPGSEIDVLMIDPQVAEGRHGEQPGADIAAHLARHGFRVNVESMPNEGSSDGANLLRHVQDVGADLLVMGGYGHARWREIVLGGATQVVLEGARSPVLFSH